MAITTGEPTFADFSLSPAVHRALECMGFVFPSMIQKKAIPLVVYGNDVLGQAKSGTGKTAVFGIAAIELVLAKQQQQQKGGTQVNPLALVLAPTREIAVQIQCVVEQLGAFCDRLAVQSCIGGLSVADDMRRLAQGCHVVVGTPGRIKSLMEQHVLVTQSIRLLVLDEADKLLMDDFHEDITWIASSLPSRRQTLAFSATFTPHLLDRTARLMRDPQLVRVLGPNEATVELLSSQSRRNPSSISREPTELWLRRVRQFYRVVPPLQHDESSITAAALPLMRLKRKIHHLAQLLSQVQFQQCIVFCNDKLSAQALGDALKIQQWPALVITSAQSQKQRLNTMQCFRDCEARILVSTDLTARGIDVHRVDFVINLELPRDPATYLHRIGRTGRFGGAGVAVTLTIDEETRAIQQLAQVFCMPVQELRDPIASDLVASCCPKYVVPSSSTTATAVAAEEEQTTATATEQEEQEEQEQQADVPRPVTRQKQLEAQTAYRFRPTQIWSWEEECYETWLYCMRDPIQKIGTGPRRD